MKKLTRHLYTGFGFLFVALGAAGMLLPVLPTTPFLLVSLYFFSRSSARWQRWFNETPLYKKYLQSYYEKNGMTIRQKISVIALSDFMLAFPFIRFSSIYIRSAILIIDIIKYWYLLTVVKTIKNDS